MLSDPSGVTMGLPPGLLEGLFIDTYILPGIFLIIAMGFLPFTTVYLVCKRIKWARTAVFLQGFILVGWIIFQIILWGQPIIVQIIYLVWGILLIVISQLPETKNHILA
jgi:hypothetical protein